MQKLLEQKHWAAVYIKPNRVYQRRAFSSLKDRKRRDLIAAGFNIFHKICESISYGETEIFMAAVLNSSHVKRLMKGLRRESGDLKNAFLQQQALAYSSAPSGPNGRTRILTTMVNLVTEKEIQLRCHRENGQPPSSHEIALARSQYAATGAADQPPPCHTPSSSEAMGDHHHTAYPQAAFLPTSSIPPIAAALPNNCHHRHMEGFTNHGGVMDENGEREGGGGGGETGVVLQYGDILPPAGGNLGQGHVEPDGVAQTSGGVGVGVGSELGMMPGNDQVGEVTTTTSAIRPTEEMLSIHQDAAAAAAAGGSCFGRSYGCGDTCVGELSRGRTEMHQGGVGPVGGEQLAVGVGAGVAPIHGCQGHHQVEPLGSQLAGQKRPRFDLSGGVHGEHVSLGGGAWKGVGGIDGGMSGVIPCDQSPSFVYDAVGGVGGGDGVGGAGAGAVGSTRRHDAVGVEGGRCVDAGLSTSSPLA